MRQFEHRDAVFFYINLGLTRLAEVYLVLMTEGEFCILDEPFSQVDPVHGEAVRDLIREKSRWKAGMTSSDTAICGRNSLGDSLGNAYFCENDKPVS